MFLVLKTKETNCFNSVPFKSRNFVFNLKRTNEKGIKCVNNCDKHSN